MQYEPVGNHAIPGQSNNAYTYADFQYDTGEFFKTKDRSLPEVVGVDKELQNLVGSRKARDIIRKERYMSNSTFKNWVDKDKTGKRKEKFMAVDEDLDNDGIGEFVVYRRIPGKEGSEAKGPMVAVNGYTTKRSDYPVRRQFFEKYLPDEKGKRAKRFSEYKYNEDDYAVDQYGYPKEEYLDKVRLTQLKTNYNLGASKVTPFTLFIKRIVFPTFNTALETWSGEDKDMAKDIRKKLDDAFTRGWLMQLAGEYWRTFVKDPIIERLKELGAYDTLKANYMTNKRISKIEDKKKFHDWIFNKAAMKDMIKEYSKPMFIEDSDEKYAVEEELYNRYDAIYDAVLAGPLGKSSPKSGKKGKKESRAIVRQ